MINFNKNTAWDLKPIDLGDVRDEITGMLVQGEHLVAAFKTVRDQLIFTSKRIISVDVQGITGKRKSYATMPYKNIQFFAVQTPGFVELVPDSELFIKFSNGFEASFEFKGKVDIGEINRMISQYVLD